MSFRTNEFPLLSSSTESERRRRDQPSSNRRATPSSTSSSPLTKTEVDPIPIKGASQNLASRGRGSPMPSRAIFEPNGDSSDESSSLSSSAASTDVKPTPFGTLRERIKKAREVEKAAAATAKKQTSTGEHSPSSSSPTSSSTSNVGGAGLRKSDPVVLKSLLTRELEKKKMEEAQRGSQSSQPQPQTATALAAPPTLQRARKIRFKGEPGTTSGTTEKIQ